MKFLTNIFFIGLFISFLASLIFIYGVTVLANDCPQVNFGDSPNISCPKASNDTIGSSLFWDGFILLLVGIFLVGIAIIQSLIQDYFHFRKQSINQPTIPKLAQIKQQIPELFDKYCPNCGILIPLGDVYCQDCGEKVFYDIVSFSDSKS